MEWIRGDSIGKGSFGKVNLAILNDESASGNDFIAVKSCMASNSAPLRREKKLLSFLKGCPQVIDCYGESWSHENGEDLYDVFMEYAPGGNLADRGALPEFKVRQYTKSILKGLVHIHGKGLVHCDVKLDNILVFANDDVKIADFGLCKEIGEKTERFEIRGTPMYLSPESVTDGEYESPADIWALGCTVTAMFSGDAPWRCEKGTEVAQLLFRIATGDETPEIPDGFSEEGKDFLRNCFVMDPRKRATAEMLLNHPFVLNAKEEEEKPWSWISPRGPLDFSFCSSIQPPESQSPMWHEEEFRGFDSIVSSGTPAEERIRQMATEDFPDWSSSKGWIAVRS